jgi:hypothetical protein
MPGNPSIIHSFPRSKWPTFSIKFLKYFSGSVSSQRISHSIRLRVFIGLFSMNLPKVSQDTMSDSNSSEMRHSNSRWPIWYLLLILIEKRGGWLIWGVAMSEGHTSRRLPLIISWLRLYWCHKEREMRVAHRISISSQIHLKRYSVHSISIKVLTLYSELWETLFSPLNESRLSQKIRNLDSRRLFRNISMQHPSILSSQKSEKIMQKYSQYQLLYQAWLLAQVWVQIRNSHKRQQPSMPFSKRIPGNISSKRK